MKKELQHWYSSYKGCCCDRDWCENFFF